MDFDIEDSYIVEHGEDFVLSEDQFRKLVESKFKRNNVLYLLDKERERKENLS